MALDSQTMAPELRTGSLRLGALGTRFLSFLPPPRRRLSGVGAVLAPGYGDGAISLLDWGAELARAGIPTLLSELPGHLPAADLPLDRFEDFQRGAPDLFAAGLGHLGQGELGGPPRAVIFGGHSLGALLAALAFGRGHGGAGARRIFLGVGFGAFAQDQPHFFESEIFAETLALRRQLVAPGLAPEAVIPWIKRAKGELSLTGCDALLLSGRDDLVAPVASVERMADRLEGLGNRVVRKALRRLPHHAPGGAAPHLRRYVESQLRPVARPEALAKEGETHGASP